ncbi:MAG: ROK family protein [Thermodesulfobacteriota bacterium]
MKTYLGLDLGGTNAKYGLVSEEGRVLRRGRFPVLAERGPEPIINDIVRHLGQLLKDLPEDGRPAGLAVGAAGVILPDQGVLAAAPNLPGWRDIPLAARLSEALGLEARIENDANLFTLGEWLAGAGRGLRNMVGLTLGTGVGGGLILNGRLWNGSFGTAAEIGHVPVEPEGRECGCGGRGCLETISSATAIANTARDLIARGGGCAYHGPPGELTAARLHELAAQGDPVALAAFGRAGWGLGVALAGVFNLLGLEGAVFGGGAAPAWEYIYPTMYAEFAARVLAVDPEKVRFVTAALGDDAPLIGATALYTTDAQDRED